MSTTSVVTGAARGLGLAIATCLAERGDHVVLVDRDEHVLEAAATLRSHDLSVSGRMADLTDADEVGGLVDALGAEHPAIDALVNNAGITRDARLAKMEVDQFSAVIAVNLVAPMRLTQALSGLMRDGSSVVNISSRAALGNFGQTNYVASKSGLVGYTRALALSWAPRVRVNAVAPGLIDSAMTQAMPEDVLAKLVDRVPLRRMGDSGDVASAVAFLTSSESAYVTGQVLNVCGGRSVSP
jgi:NAD(P)-dependent dehydrogenase (short-subunit alcohol dehydrogenase family)